MMKISIKKDQLSPLPRVTFPGHIVVVDNADKLDSALKQLRQAGIVGFDTETRPSFKKGVSHSVALMQISTIDTCFLLRVNCIGIPEQLRMFLEDEAVTKVGVSLRDDFHVIHKVHEARLAGFIDLQSLVPKYGIADSSLQKIYAIIFGGRISKGQRLSNWEADTLTEAQQEYAAIDAWACLKIYNHLLSGGFDPDSSQYIIPESDEI